MSKNPEFVTSQTGI